MADYIFFTNPMSRGQIARWALHEANAEYDTEFVEWDNKTEEFLKVNPMAKVPALVHRHGDHVHVITEAAAICHYLAEMSAPDLLPEAEEKASYYRWMFFAAGPVEQAVTSRAMGWDVPPEREIMAGFGNFDRTIAALNGWFETHDFVCGDRFTMADVYVGSQVDWGLMFGTIPTSPALEAYANRLRGRDAYKAAKAIDQKLIDEAQGNG